MSVAAGVITVVVARRAELADPGAMLARHVAGHDIVLANTGDALVALAAHCTHACGPLAEGAVTPRGLSCPWHWATFDPHSGAVTRGPARKPLATFAVVVDGDDVLVVVPT